MEANVILAKCGKNGRPFGMRVEKRGGDWVRTWAFKIDEAKAKNEGFDKTPIKGSLNAVAGYPGCPHCGAGSFVQCGCGKLCCWNGSPSAHCRWCGIKTENIAIGESFAVSSGGF